MNTEAIRTEIEKIVSDNRNKLRGARQYPVTRAVRAELEALGIFQFIPQWMNRGYVGLSDAKAVLAAAKQAKNTSAVFNAYGEGEDVSTDASTLYLLLNEKPAPEAAEEIQVGDYVEVLPHAVYGDLSAGASVTPMYENHHNGAKRVRVSAIFDHGNGDLEVEYEVGDDVDMVAIQHCKKL